MNKHGEFIWYELMTPEPLAARRFYEAVVGWRIDERGAGDMDYRMISAGDGYVGGVLTLTKDMQAHGARPVWLGYLGVDDVDATIKKVQAAGGKVQMPATDIHNVGRIAMLTDPQGAPFYVMRGTSDETSTAFAPSKQGHCAWNELFTSDPKAALTFYSNTFGWEAGGTMPVPELGDYQFVNHAGAMIGAIMPTPPMGRPTIWCYYFRVPDAQVAADATKANGGQIHHGPQPIPTGERIIVGSDPQGAIFALVGK